MSEWGMKSFGAVGTSRTRNLPGFTRVLYHLSYNGLAVHLGVVTYRLAAGYLPASRPKRG